MRLVERSDLCGEVMIVSLGGSLVGAVLLLSFPLWNNGVMYRYGSMLMASLL